MTSKTAVSVCRVCGLKIPPRCVLCHECARNAADHFMFNFHVDKAEGRRMLVQTFLDAGVDPKKLRGIDVRDRFPMAFKAKAKAKKFISKLGTFKSNSAMCSAGARHGNDLRRAKKFERWAKGTRKIKEYFE